MNGEKQNIKDYECLIDEVRLLHDAGLIDDATEQQWSGEIKMHCMERDQYLYGDLLQLLSSRTREDIVQCDVDSPTHQRLLLEAYVDLDNAGLPIATIRPYDFCRKMVEKCLLEQPDELFGRMVDYQEYLNAVADLH